MCFDLGLGIKYLNAKRENLYNPSYTYDKFIEHSTFGSILIAFLSFTPVSTIIFQTYGCQTFEDGQYRLIADYSVNCSMDNITYRSYVIYASFMFFVYPFGIPVVYYLLLRKYKEKINPFKLTGSVHN